MKSAFVSTVSHQLRAPLTSIYGFAETLLRRDILFGEAERETFLGYIASEAQRLTSIVDTLLTVARLEAGDLHVELAPTDLRAGRVRGRHERPAGRRAERAPLRARVCRRSRWPPRPIRESSRQILTNLLDNAVKFSPDGGTVTVEAHRRRGRVEVRVVDEGQGIPEGEREHIFSKFHRSESSGGPRRRGPRPLHRARARDRDGRAALGRHGRGRRLELRVRASSRRCD